MRGGAIQLFTFYDFPGEDMLSRTINLYGYFCSEVMNYPIRCDFICFIFSLLVQTLYKSKFVHHIYIHTYICRKFVCYLRLFSTCKT